MKQTITEQQLAEFVANVVKTSIDESVDERKGWGFFNTASDELDTFSSLQKRRKKAFDKGKTNRVNTLDNKLGKSVYKINAAREGMGLKLFDYRQGDKPDFVGDSYRIKQFQTWANQNLSLEEKLVVDGKWGPKSQNAFNMWIIDMKKQVGVPEIGDTSGITPVEAGDAEKIKKNAGNVIKKKQTANTETSPKDNNSSTNTETYSSDWSENTTD